MDVGRVQETWPEAAEYLGMEREQLLELLRTEESRGWFFGGNDPWEWLAGLEAEVAELEEALWDDLPDEEAEMEALEEVPIDRPEGPLDPTDFLASAKEITPEAGSS